MFFKTSLLLFDSWWKVDWHAGMPTFRSRSWSLHIAETCILSLSRLEIIKVSCQPFFLLVYNKTFCYCFLPLRMHFSYFCCLLETLIFVLLLILKYLLFFDFTNLYFVLSGALINAFGAIVLGAPVGTKWVWI